jgi:hypothetical protein
VKESTGLEGHLMRCNCPYCSKMVAQKLNRTGPNFCPNCWKLFYRPKTQTSPRWVYGVLAILVLNLHVNLGFSASVLSGAWI